MTSKGTPGIGLFCGIVALSAASCTQTNVVPVEVKDITVIPDRLSALVSDQATLATELRDQDGNLLTDRPIRWESLDPSVVVVQDGVVTAVGPGQALVTASSDGAVGSAQVTVRQRPTVRISSELVEMEAAQGSNATVSRVLAVDNGGGGTLGSLSTSISYTSGEGEWLSASLSTTTAPTELTVSVRGRGLPEGSYEGQVAVSDGEASTSVTVALTVTEPPPEISLSPSSVSFSGIVDQSPPSSQSVSVTNGGGGNLNALGLQIVYGGTSGWLDATLSRATAPATITLRPSTTSMEAGTYTATVQVTSPVADNRVDRGHVRSVGSSRRAHPASRLRRGGHQHLDDVAGPVRQRDPFRDSATQLQPELDDHRHSGDQRGVLFGRGPTTRDVVSIPGEGL